MQKITIVKSTGELEKDIEIYENFKKVSTLPTIHCEAKIKKYILDNYGGEILESEVIEIFSRILEIFSQKDSYWFVKYVLEELERIEEAEEVIVFCLNFTTPVLLKKFISNTDDIKFINCSSLAKLSSTEVSGKVQNLPTFEYDLEILKISHLYTILLAKSEIKTISTKLLSILNRILVYILVKNFHRQRREVIELMCYKTLV